MDDELEDLLDDIRERHLPPEKKEKKGIWKLWVAVLIVILFAGIATAQILFQHTLPSVGTLTTSCQGSLANQNSPPSSGTGNVLFTCPGGTAPLVSTGISATPTISGLSGQTLYLVLHSLGATSCSGGFPLVTGSPINIPNGTYDYCLEATASPTPQITVSWNQP